MPLSLMQNMPGEDDLIRLGMLGLGETIQEKIKREAAGGFTPVYQDPLPKDEGQKSNIFDNILKLSAAGAILAKSGIEAKQALQKPKKQKVAKTDFGPLPEPQREGFNWKLWVPVGLGVAALGVAGYMVLRKPRPVAANPRRRSRRRRR